jgi:hypothetical protein
MTRDILCDSCSDVALKAGEAFSADRFNSESHYCLSCGEPGKVEQVDDGEQAMLVFSCHIPYELSDLFGDLERQVAKEASCLARALNLVQYKVSDEYTMNVGLAMEWAGWNKRTREVAA